MTAKKAMIEEILMKAKRPDGAMFLALAFRTEAELRSICAELFIPLPKPEVRQ